MTDSIEERRPLYFYLQVSDFQMSCNDFGKDKKVPVSLHRYNQE